MESVADLETASSGWKPEILAFILYRHIIISTVATVFQGNHHVSCSRLITTIRYHWPLFISELYVSELLSRIFILILSLMGIWYLWVDSNHWPLPYEDTALSTELQRHFMVGRVGFEPTMFATRVRDLQSRALATMRPTHIGYAGFTLQTAYPANNDCNVLIIYTWARMLHLGWR